MEILLLLLIIHILGGIIVTIFNYKDGSMEWAAKYGDGIRTAKPADIICLNMLVWEVLLVITFAFKIEDKINDIVSSKFTEND